jgi:hypothetical protein
VLLSADPSVLHLIQEGEGAFQKTSLMTGALGGCKVMLNFFNKTKSDIETQVALVQLPTRLIFDIIEEIELFQGILMLLNLSWFLAYQIALIVKTNAALTTTLHCLFENLL